MKRIFNIVLVFIALALSLLLEPSTLQPQPIDSIGYIQNTRSESIVLASNNLLGGEIYSNQEEESPSLSGGTPFFVSFETKNDSFNKNKTQLNGCFIHNLSANKQKAQQIRAP